MWRAQDNVLPPHPSGQTLRLQFSPPQEKKKGSLGTCTACSQPSPAARHALTTMTGPYAEMTFPFRISAGAMTSVSPLPTMVTDKTEVRLSPLLRGTAQHTCLATAQADPATARALPWTWMRACAVQTDLGPSSSEKLNRGRVWNATGRWGNSVEDWMEEMIGWWKDPFQNAPSCGRGISWRGNHPRFQPFGGGARGGAEGRSRRRPVWLAREACAG